MIINSVLSFSSSAVVMLTTNEKLAIKASNSLPEFFQEEFPTFQQFIDYYYQYLSSTREGFTSIESIKDIDAIGAKYLQEFYKVYAPGIPVFPYMGMADFIRNAKRFYVSRGSEDSFRFLFRVMFGEEIDFKYPKENLFIASSGKWNQKVSIYVKITSGTVNSTLIGKNLLIKALDGSTSTLTVKGFSVRTTGDVLPESGEWDPTMPWSDLSVWVDSSDPYYEIEVEKFVGQNIVAGAKVFAIKDQLTGEYQLEGEIAPTLNRYQVLLPGEDFLLGSVHSAGKVKFRVTALDGNKGIKNIEFLEFGDINQTSLTYNITKTSSGPITEFGYTIPDSGVLDDDLFWSDNGFWDDEPEIEGSLGAVIKFIPSAVNRYTGYYDNTDGFVSNNSKLHDGFFYQIFSYVIKSKVSRELYEAITLQILHPAGLMMFSELEDVRSHQLELATESKAEQSLSPIDVVHSYDSFDRTGTFFRSFSDNVALSDPISFKVDKFFEDTLFATDSSFMTVGKTFSETVYPGEVNTIEYWEAGTYVDYGYTNPELYTFNSYQTITNNYIYETNPLDWNANAVWRNYQIWSNGGSTDTSDNNLFAGSPFEWEDFNFWNDNLTWVN
jgi:hypothetical protein